MHLVHKGNKILLQKIKKYLPKAVKSFLRAIYNRLVLQWQKRCLFIQMQAKHEIFLKEIKNKKNIRVVFLAIHKSIWKVDAVFQKMLADPLFDPIVLVCPNINSEQKKMLQDMNETLNYFNEKGYPVYSSYDESEGRWISLSDLSVDIVFFTNPHNLTRKEYYQDAFLNFLTCYAPYFSDVASSYDLHDVYNQFFHNSLWLNFVQDQYSKKRALSVMANNGKNIRISGSLFVESLSLNSEPRKLTWKWQPIKKKKIIYATHQSINQTEIINFSTFIDVGESMKYLAIKYRDTIQWSFRPHPLLKSKLYSHSDWGIEKTNAYYDFWENSDFTQLDNDDYINLFLTSDAIIHDCGSFILEYLYTGKACGYILIDKARQLKAINDCGIRALRYYKELKSSLDIEKFIIDISKSDYDQAKSYLNNFKIEFLIDSNYKNSSDIIINIIKREINN